MSAAVHKLLGCSVIFVILGPRSLVLHLRVYERGVRTSRLYLRPAAVNSSHMTHQLPLAEDIWIHLQQPHLGALPAADPAQNLSSRETARVCGNSPSHRGVFERDVQRSPESILAVIQILNAIADALLCHDSAHGGTFCGHDSAHGGTFCGLGSWRYLLWSRLRSWRYLLWSRLSSWRYLLWSGSWRYLLDVLETVDVLVSEEAFDSWSSLPETNRTSALSSLLGAWRTCLPH
ncbi:hypothetical protein WMY93_034249 [Mugilogobius chulae]|uniref:Uncharacterized protein n=1 Tax=Mugilogobius chulae TaxID=88201 RepID=A0AAW0MF67_9GOBI